MSAPGWATYKQRCCNCHRRVFGTDFMRGLAASGDHWQETLGGYYHEDCVYHTYDCWLRPRRVVPLHAPQSTERGSP